MFTQLLAGYALNEIYRPIAKGVSSYFGAGAYGDDKDAPARNKDDWVSSTLAAVDKLRKPDTGRRQEETQDPDEIPRWPQSFENDDSFEHLRQPSLSGRGSLDEDLRNAADEYKERQALWKEQTDAHRRELWRKGLEERQAEAEKRKAAGENETLEHRIGNWNDGTNTEKQMAKEVGKALDANRDLLSDPDNVLKLYEKRVGAQQEANQVEFMQRIQSILDDYERRRMLKEGVPRDASATRGRVRGRGHTQSEKEDAQVLAEDIGRYLAVTRKAVGNHTQAPVADWHNAQAEAAGKQAEAHEMPVDTSDFFPPMSRRGSNTTILSQEASLAASDPDNIRSTQRWQNGHAQFQQGARNNPNNGVLAEALHGIPGKVGITDDGRRLSEDERPPEQISVPAAEQRRHMAEEALKGKTDEACARQGRRVQAPKLHTVQLRRDPATGIVHGFVPDDPFPNPTAYGQPPQHMRQNSYAPSMGPTYSAQPLASLSRPPSIASLMPTQSVSSQLPSSQSQWSMAPGPQTAIPVQPAAPIPAPITPRPAIPIQPTPPSPAATPPNPLVPSHLAGDPKQLEWLRHMNPGMLQPPAPAGSPAMTPYLSRPQTPSFGVPPPDYTGNSNSLIPDRSLDPSSTLANWTTGYVPETGLMRADNRGSVASSVASGFDTGSVASMGSNQSARSVDSDSGYDSGEKDGGETARQRRLKRRRGFDADQGHAFTRRRLPYS